MRGPETSREIVIGEIVQHVGMAAVLLEDLQNPRVLVIGRGKNARRFAAQEHGGVRPASIDHPANDQHGGRLAAAKVFANPGCSRRRVSHSRLVHQSPFDPNEPLFTPKQKRGLIAAGILASLIGLAVVAGMVAIYINNFNILRWME